MSILEITELSKYFGGIKALDKISLSVNTNSLTALIGPNGCGKSTLFNVVSGVLPANGGSVMFDGTQLLGLPAHKINALGFSRTFQDTRLYQDLTVVENLMLPPKAQIGESILNLFYRRNAIKAQEDGLLDKALEVLDLLDIRHMGYEYTKNLSGGQSKLVDIGRVLMSDPKLLLLDEPTAGVNPALTERLFQKIVELKDQLGLTILLIEHDMDIIMREEVDHVYVANMGMIVASGKPEVVQKDQQVIEAYLGR